MTVSLSMKNTSHGVSGSDFLDTHINSSVANTRTVALMTRNETTLLNLGQPVHLCSTLYFEALKDITLTHNARYLKLRFSSAPNRLCPICSMSSANWTDTCLTTPESMSDAQPII